MTGESLTGAVTEALRERLERELRQRDRAALRARLVGLAAEIRASLKPATLRDRSADAFGGER